MKAKDLCLVFVLSSLFMAPAALANPLPTASDDSKLWRFDALTIRINCDRGGSVAKALSFRAHRLTVKFSGVCVEDVVIDRDRVTLEGNGPGATLEGDPDVPGPALTISGVSEVDLVDFTVRGGDSFGVSVQRNGEARLERVTIADTPSIGLLVDRGSSAHLVDSTSTGHQFFGSAVFGSSGLTVEGSNDFSGNGQVGLLMSDGASLHTQGALGTLTANDNGGVGIVLQSGAVGLFPSAVATGNGFAGLQLTFAASFSSIGNDNNFSDNAVFGVFMFENAKFQAAGSIQNNAVAGVMASEEAVVSIATDVPSTISGSSVGVILDGSIGTFDSVDVDSIDLTFGSRAIFFEGATVTSLTCDSTVLTRGIACPSSLAAPNGGSKTANASRVALEWRGARRLFRLPPF